MKKDVNIFGKVNFRNEVKKFGIKADDRRRHMYIIGKTGMGKTTILENMVYSDIQAGHGVGVVDPHGEFAEKILDFIPEHRLDDVVYFNPSDIDHPIGFNPIEQVGNEFRHLIASSIMGVFKKIWPDVWSSRMEYILNNALLALLEYPDSTLLGIMRLLNDKEYRRRIVENLQDPVIKSFWVNEFSRYSQKFETEATAAIQNKIGQFISNPLIRNILGQSQSAISMRKIMDEKKILIVNLSKGKMGEDNSALLGSMIITRLQLAAMSRVDIPEKDRKDFYLYVDEFQNFATDSFANILSEARKYRLCLILAHQYISQLTHDGNTKVRDAVFGNVGTIVTFRIGAEDAEFLEKEFLPDFTANDLVNLPKYNTYIKLLIDGMASRPFSAEMLPPFPSMEKTFKETLIKNSRTKYGTPRQVVEKNIAGEWMEDMNAMDERMGRRSEPSPPERGFNNSPSRSPMSGNAPSSRPPIRQPSQPPANRPMPIQPMNRRPDNREAPPAPPLEKREKKEVNLSDLRKSIDEALKKNNQEIIEAEKTRVSFLKDPELEEEV